MFWVFFVGFQVVVLGVALFVLLLAREGVRAAEEWHAAERQGVEVDAELVSIPRFFARPRPGQPVTPEPSVDDLAVARFEQYLRLEDEQAEEFVCSPSVSSLYQNSERRVAFN